MVKQREAGTNEGEEVAYITGRVDGTTPRTHTHTHTRSAADVRHDKHTQDEGEEGEGVGKGGNDDTEQRGHACVRRLETHDTRHNMGEHTHTRAPTLGQGAKTAASQNTQGLVLDR